MKLRSLGTRLLLAAALVLIVSFQSFAATGKIAFSDPSTKVGDEFSINMKFTCVEGAPLGNTDVMLAYDPQSLEYINETENANGGAGAIRVWTAPVGASESTTVLRFKALKAGTTKITVSSWEAYDNDGQFLNVEKEGSSTITIAASAAGEQIESGETAAAAPEENGEAVTEAGESETEAAEVLADLDVTAKKIRIINLPDSVAVPSGFRESSIAIGDTKVPGWTWAADESPRYCVFYGMNENGDQNFYRYDLTEKTVQRYFEDQSGAHSDEEFNTLAEDYNSLLDEYRLFKILAIVFGVLSVVLLIALIVVKARSGRKEDDPYERFEKEPQRRTRKTSERRMTRKERYMRGEEESYEENYEEEEPAEYQEESEPEQLVPLEIEKDMERELAAESQAVSEKQKEDFDDVSGDDDDFEFFDL